MYAVVRTGGKQYRVSPGDILEVEKLAGDVGDSIVLEDVLMVAGEEGIEIGQPNVAGASVTARITGQHRGEKILVFRYRPKKRVRVRRGHRQYLTRLQIDKISGDGFEYGGEEKEEAAPEEIVEAAVAEAAVAAVAETSSIAEAEETIETVVEEEADIVDRAVDAVEAVGDAVGEVASDAVEAVSDKAGDAVEAVGDLAEDAVEAVGDLAEDAVDAVTKNLKGLVGRGKKADDAEDNEKKEE
ncbi:MAG: 50S ribosomal protein L21 [Caldilineaceae bacterium]|nr:50S ribosomal protein L21 [Caldilineaceae bacterium]